MGFPLPPCVAYGSWIVDANQQPALCLVQIDGPTRYRESVCEAMMMVWVVFHFGLLGS
jgi:hypothetical protein